MLLNLRIAATSVLIALIVGCGDDEKKEESSGNTTTLKYANVQALITSSCAGAGCHAATSPQGGINLSTEAAVRTNAAAAAAAIDGGTMPVSSTSGKTAWDAATAQARADVSTYLKAGAPQ